MYISIYHTCKFYAHHHTICAQVIYMLTSTPSSTLPAIILHHIHILQLSHQSKDCHSCWITSCMPIKHIPKARVKGLATTISSNNAGLVQNHRHRYKSSPHSSANNIHILKQIKKQNIWSLFLLSNFVQTHVHKLCRWSQSNSDIDHYRPCSMH